MIWLADRIQSSVGKWLMITRKFLCNINDNSLGVDSIYSVYCSEILSNTVNRYDCGSWDVFCQRNLFRYDKHNTENHVISTNGLGNIWLDTFQIVDYAQLTRRFDVRLHYGRCDESCAAWDSFIVADTEEEALKLFVEKWKDDPSYQLLKNPTPWINSFQHVVRC